MAKDDTKYTFLSKNIKNIRHVYGLTQQEFADLVGTTLPSIKSYEGGRAKPNYIVLSRISILAAAEFEEMMNEEIPIADIEWMKANHGKTALSNNRNPLEYGISKESVKIDQANEHQDLVTEANSIAKALAKTTKLYLGEPVQRMRQLLKYSINQLAKTISVDPQKIENLEKGFIFNFDDPDLKIIEDWLNKTALDHGIVNFSPESIERARLDTIKGMPGSGIPYFDAISSQFLDFLVTHDPEVKTEIASLEKSIRIPGVDGDFAITLIGDFVWPRFRTGDIIICKQTISRDQTWNSVREGEVYFIITVDGPIVGKLNKSLMPGNFLIEVRKENNVQLTHELSKNRITAICLIKAVISRLSM
jgi:transcriptional regulator with XRE-family HTH domain